jgi:hypothetical protein
MKRTVISIAALIFCVGVVIQTPAQSPVPPPGSAVPMLSSAELDQLLGPIALYPDPLIAQILPAATQPSQIVLANRYVSGGGDVNQIDEQPWDPSVQALARYPDMLKWMDDNLAWTTQLGQAFLNQQQDVMNSIQRLRAQAMALGNLQSTPQQQVINNGGYIEIVPVDTQVIYVPVYQPDEVYYQTADGSPFVTFGIGCPIGAWLNCDLDWYDYNIIVWGRDHPRPADWWRHPHDRRDFSTGNHTVWHPPRPGISQLNRAEDRGWGAPNNQPVVATIGRSVSGSVAPRLAPAPAARPEAPATRSSMPVARPTRAPTVMPRSAPPEVFNKVQPESNGAFIGAQSANDTRAFSNRGGQSRQAMTAPAPAPRPTPQGRISGGSPSGANSSNSNQRKR